MTPLDSPELAPYVHLHGAREVHHPEAGPCFICEGRYLVEEALKDTGGLRVLSVLMSDRLEGELASLLPPEVKALVLPEAELSALLGFPFHRGLLACVAVPPEPPLARLQEARRLLVLPRLDNVDNLGSLLRTAAALGLEGVLAGRGPGTFDRRTVRVSMGAAWRLPVWRRTEDAALMELLEAWRAGTGGEVVAAALGPEAQPVAHWIPGEAVALVLGPEGPGLDEAWLSRCDRQVAIPMHHGMDSLNVGVAGAILMARQVGLV